MRFIVNSLLNDFNQFKKDILHKIDNLCFNLQQEIALHQPIIISFPKEHEKKVKAYQKKLRKIKQKILHIQNAHLMKQFEAQLQAIETQMRDLVQAKQDDVARFFAQKTLHKLHVPLLHMKAKMAIQKFKRMHLQLQLNGLCQFFIGDIDIEYIKDEWFVTQNSWHQLKFIPNDKVSSKMMSLLLATYCHDLLDLLVQGYSDADIKMMFVQKCAKIFLDNDTTFLQNTSRAEKLRRMAQKLLLQKKLQECMNMR